MKRLAALLLCLGFGALLAQTASAQSEKWDQKKVTALSAQLVSSVSGVQDALWNSTQAQDPMMEETVSQIADVLGVFEFEATHLNAMLSSGKGLKRTLPAYRRLQELHAELSGYSGQIAMSDFLGPPTAKAKAALAELAKYYPPQP